MHSYIYIGIRLELVNYAVMTFLQAKANCKILLSFVCDIIILFNGHSNAVNVSVKPRPLKFVSMSFQNNTSPYSRTIFNTITYGC